ncbi:sulfite exporter TauE/SafE family protein [Ammonifex thiophilus]|uniref:Probable membrane transporter protein n=1 Tax=Ammonifex thiophilus TaxID=444093 RepID=A0A3D8P161_9THEO|nr:sulfite exporter TauE/SafE family protein [Ammonifex thiophilus]RDV81199.1 sulfite exporter TauE/SafE family protein [Ammonifex thiophilus]
MHIFLPIANMDLPFLAVLGLGGVVGFLSGLFGVGGGFLLTPVLLMVGVPPAVATASDTNQIVAASVSGTVAHARSGNVDFKLGSIILVGGLLGGTIGTDLVRHLRTLGHFDFVVKVAYVVMLLSVGVFMFQESLRALRRREHALETPHPPKWVRTLPWRLYFPVSGIECSALALLLLGFLIGMLAAIMGVGGGFIMLPVMIYLLGIPTLKAVGTSIFTVVFTAINVTLAQATVNGTVDVVLAVLLLLGSSIGAQLGAKVSRRLAGEQLRIAFSIIVLAVMAKMLYQLVTPPPVLFAFGGGH